MSFPQYMRIALDIANRIASGEIAERQRISGRSLLSSQYHVSPETVRKALSLLRDMDVVQVKEKSGVIILSADAARSFLSSFKGQREQQELRTQLHDLTEQNQAISRRIAEVCDQLLEAQTRALPPPAGGGHAGVCGRTGVRGGGGAVPLRRSRRVMGAFWRRAKKWPYIFAWTVVKIAQ